MKTTAKVIQFNEVQRIGKEKKEMIISRPLKTTNNTILDFYEQLYDRRQVIEVHEDVLEIPYSQRELAYYKTIRAIKKWWYCVIFTLGFLLVFCNGFAELIGYFLF